MGKGYDMFPCIFWAQSLFCGIVAVSFLEMVWTFFFLPLFGIPLGTWIAWNHQVVVMSHDGLLVRGALHMVHWKHGCISNSYLSNTAIFSHDYGRKKVNMPEKKGPQKERIVSLSHHFSEAVVLGSVDILFYQYPGFIPSLCTAKTMNLNTLPWKKHNYSWRYTPFFPWTIIIGDV